MDAEEAMINKLKVNLIDLFLLIRFYSFQQIIFLASMWVRVHQQAASYVHGHYAFSRAQQQVQQLPERSQY